MKILIYTQFCTPEPSFKSVPFAKELCRRGHDVKILTGFPNYPGGRLYPGYPLRPWRRERVDGFDIMRVPLWPSHDQSVFFRILNYTSFVTCSAGPLFLGWRPDVIYVYNLVTLGFLCALNRWCRGIPYVMDVMDLWPDSVGQSNMGRCWMKAPIGTLSRIAYGSATRVVASSPGMAEVLADRGIQRARLSFIYNWCDEQSLRLGAVASGQLPEGFRGRFNVLFAGNMGPAQGLDTVIEAAALAGRIDPTIQFVFLGEGILRSVLEQLACRIAPKNTVFLPFRPQKEASLVMALSDVLIIHLKPIPLFDYTIPSKTQAYLASGRPIIAAVGRDTTHLVQTAGAGVSCKAGDPRLIAEAAVQLARVSKEDRDAMGRRGREFYQRELSMTVGVDRWERVFREAVACVK